MEPVPTCMETMLLKENPRVARPGLDYKIKPPIVSEQAAVILGRLSGFDESANPLVDFASNDSETSMPARSLVTLSSEQIGAEVVIAFDQGYLSRPIILGCISEPAMKSVQNPVNVKVDGRQITFNAEQEIVLTCGKASITLTRAGKVVISGEYILSRSSGAN